ncbi:DUF4167 domain-containing protein [Brucella tritici]|uniref:DUF4167 domain-containing protein n=1 Tax=Brucella tritici TaxID=94626 RepID=A0A6N6QQC9_9HYPH|nr:DUF4167 domain-containing protein [Brucella tritici]KAB2656705.1 DUF4167 domain-containing protein [Brucella tritici]KAB2677296.1 DUF4167 domain-containing protein [Brucella tritici]KAB2689894.1 DUF4167 domain-containing protein [Brucella tritici]
MRPAQQNRRMRGRGNNNNNNNNNRKGPNPLSRNYESNGPDVKIRGNAQHIAEKYSTLARDAQASGDRVMAENYLQHAEHYNRIIMAAMAQNPVPFQREETFDDDGSDDEEAGFTPVAAQPQPVNGSGPQPVIEGTPAEVVYGEDGGEPVKSGEGRQQPRERDNRDRRLGRGRRPQRERFNADERSDEQPQEKQAQPVAEEASAPVEVVAEQAAPAVVEVAPAADAASAEEAAPRRATRRPGRPRRAAKDSGDETPATEPANSDA